MQAGGWLAPVMLADSSSFAIGHVGSSSSSYNASGLLLLLLKCFAMLVMTMTLPATGVAAADCMALAAVSQGSITRQMAEYLCFEVW